MTKGRAAGWQTDGRDNGNGNGESNGKSNGEQRQIRRFLASIRMTMGRGKTEG